MEKLTPSLRYKPNQAVAYCAYCCLLWMQAVCRVCKEI